jgi:hypothetical protein
MTGHRKHQPAPADLVFQNLVDAGQALAAEFAALAADPTIERADRLLMSLQGASDGVRQHRRRMVNDQEARRDPD